jgi:hypothetical protein
MTPPTLQAICTEIWAHPHRTQLVGTPLVASNLLESFCVACWANSVRTITALPVAHWHALEGPSKLRLVIDGPSKFPVQTCGSS